MSVLKIKDSNNNWIAALGDVVGIPSGGTDGQSLVKTSSSDYAVAWATISGGGGVAENGLPTGGTDGQFLKKTGTTNYDATWATVTIPSTASDVGALPSNTIYVSTVNGTSGAVTIHGLPSGGTDGQSLVKTGSTDYAVAWTTVTIPSAATALPADLGTAAIGSSSKFAREDHVHEKPDNVYIGTSAPSDSSFDLWLDTDATPVREEVVHIGSSAPTNPDIDIWIDTDEQGQSTVTSVNGQSGAVTMGTFTSGTDGIWTYRKYNDGTYHAWWRGSVSLLAGTTWGGGYFHQTASAMTPPSFSTEVTSMSGFADATQLLAFVGHATDYSTYWFNGISQAVSGYPVRIDMYGTW